LKDAHNLDLDLSLGHTAYHCVSLIDLYLPPNVTEIEETFLGGRAYGRTDAHLRPTLLGRFRRVYL